MLLRRHCVPATSCIQLKKRPGTNIYSCRQAAWPCTNEQLQLGKQGHACPGVYEKLLAMEGGEKDNEIARDLNRTYPTHVFYQQSEGAGQTSLYHVLKTYSVYDKKVTTCHAAHIVSVICSSFLLFFWNSECLRFLSVSHLVCSFLPIE